MVIKFRNRPSKHFPRLTNVHRVWVHNTLQGFVQCYYNVYWAVCSFQLTLYNVKGHACSEECMQKLRIIANCLEDRTRQQSTSLSPRQEAQEGFVQHSTDNCRPVAPREGQMEWTMSDVCSVLSIDPGRRGHFQCKNSNIIHFQKLLLSQCFNFDKLKLGRFLKV